MDLGFQGGFKFLGKSFTSLPFKIVWANEINKAACRAYEANFGHSIINDDVWNVMDLLPTRADVVIGGFPCQDISVNNGKGQGVLGSRSGLYRAMVEAVRRTQPKIFIAENVKGLLFKRNSPSLALVLKDFAALGYRVTFKLYNAADYGVPQTRERVMIVGTHPTISDFVPPPALYNSKDHWIDAHRALSDLETTPENLSFSHFWSKAKKSPEQGSRYLKRDRPGYTIRAECHGNIQWHYELPRRISMREAARLQSFPDEFLFHAKIRETERMVGNAVPPILAWHMAKAVLTCLESQVDSSEG